MVIVAFYFDQVLNSPAYESLTLFFFLFQVGRGSFFVLFCFFCVITLSNSLLSNPANFLTALCFQDRYSTTSLGQAVYGRYRWG